MRRNQIFSQPQQMSHSTFYQMHLDLTGRQSVILLVTLYLYDLCDITVMTLTVMSPNCYDPNCYVTFVTYFEADFELVRVTSFKIIVPFVVQCNPFAFCKSSNQLYFNIIISSREPVITFSVIFKRSRCEGQIGLNHQ